MPLERRTTFNFCSSSLDETQLQATGLFGTGSLRRHATIGMLPQNSYFTCSCKRYTRWVVSIGAIESVLLFWYSHSYRGS